MNIVNGSLQIDCVTWLSTLLHHHHNNHHDHRWDQTVEEVDNNHTVVSPYKNTWEVHITWSTTSTRWRCCTVTQPIFWKKHSKPVNMEEYHDAEDYYSLYKQVGSWFWRVGCRCTICTVSIEEHTHTRYWLCQNLMWLYCWIILTRILHKILLNLMTPM